MRKPILADISLLFVTFIWGTTFVLVQNAISLLEPFSFNGIRFLAAAVMLLLWLFIFERKQLALLNLKMLASGVFIGFWLFLGYATQTIGLVYTTTSKAGFITGLSVIFVPLFSMFLLKQFPSRNAVIGVSIASIGLFLLTMTDVSSLNIGDGFVFICAISFALQIIFTGKFSSKYPTLLLTVIQISTVAVLSILSAFIFEDWRRSFNPEILLAQDVIVALMITSILATALAFWIQTNFQKYTTATRVALIFAMEPVFAAIAGYYWADERLSLSALVGCLLIFAGMIFAELPAKKFPVLRKDKSFQG
ncbi:drug/metabolite transporter (DMT)-like permease [Neobacillus niacini]|jgi:drug/metabolite transporter (DMT)-like permease|uniref:DMT family transporter n=1 Tax=Neobacillus niacini TaxID=86668 RepID=UPI002780963E|nr:DMT family transporter [Neobacillus niacini]MDQ1001842.1 drug/metabolite transporter (DMT)-like permease [Neobacillus niacini]